MAPITLDFSGVGEGFEPFPVGEHPFRIWEIKSKIGKDSQQPYMEWTFKHKDSERRVWNNFSLQPQSLWVLKATLADLGYDAESMEGEFEFEPNDVIGMEVILVLDVEQYQGKDKNVVKRIMTPEMASASSRGW